MCVSQVIVSPHVFVPICDAVLVALLVCCRHLDRPLFFLCLLAHWRHSSRVSNTRSDHQAVAGNVLNDDYQVLI